MTTGLRGAVSIGGALCVVALVLCDARDARAACTPSAPSNATFGSMTSFAIRNSTQQTSTSDAGVTCTGTGLGLMQSGDHFFVTITSANGGLKGPSGDVVPYSIYGDSTTNFPIAIGVQYDYAGSALPGTLGLFGGPAVSLPLFFRTVTGANVAAGAYADTLTISWSWDYCSGLNLFGICLGRDNGSTVTTVQLSATVQTACLLTTPDLTFGSAPTARSFPVVSQNIGVLCTKDTITYTIGVSNGSQPASGRRRMTSGANLLHYDLFKPNSSSVWGPLSGDRVGNSSPADGLNTQNYQYSARIYTDLPTPPVGHYTDTLVVDVAF
jgi:spore coat protein U-like protein